MFSIALLIGAAANLALLVYGLHTKSYDAYIHMFFSKHYLQHPLQTWNSLWYGGFDQLSYPPLTHLVVAFFSQAFGFKVGYVVTQLLALIILWSGFFHFALIFSDSPAARFSTILCIFSSAVAQCVYEYGQLPTLFSLGLLLWCGYFAHLALVHGGVSTWSMFAGLFWMMLGSHHITAAFGPIFFLLPIFARHWLLQPKSQRSAMFGSVLPNLLIVAVVGIMILLPFIVYLTRYQLPQLEIPHGSREMLFGNWMNFGNFLLIPYLSLLAALPILLRSWNALSGLRFLLVPLALLVVFGLGGTTPLPKLMLGGMFQVLTFDRFTLWATILLTVISGSCVVRTQGVILPAPQDLVLWGPLARWTIAGAAVAWLATIAFVASYQFQPGALELRPAAMFLAKHSRDYRYLTLGFGNQLALLGVLSNAANVDGAYHSARRAQILRDSGIESLDGAKYFGSQGLKTLEEYLIHPENHNLKYVLVNDAFYDSILQSSGWRPVTVLAKQISVWTTGRNVPVIIRSEPKGNRWIQVAHIMLPLLVACLVLITGAWKLLSALRRPQQMVVLAQSNRQQLPEEKRVANDG